MLVLLAIDLLLDWRVSAFFSALAILHGAIVGFLWDELDQGSDFRTGERIHGGGGEAHGFGAPTWSVTGSESPSSGMWTPSTVTNVLPSETAETA